MKSNYIIDYVNENEFKKKERSVKKYNMLAYKKLLFDYYPGLREGNFQGVLVSTNEKDRIDKYELTFAKKIDLSISSHLVHALTNLKEVFTLEANDYHVTPLDK